MNRTLAGLIGGVPELLAGALTAACILTPYYALHHERTPTTMTVEQPRYDVSAEVLQLETRDGEPYVKTMPLPEHVLIPNSLWDEAQDNAYYMLHIDASNVTASFRLLAERAEYRLCRVERWSER